mgnify:CR=1 FL=1
MSKDNLTIDVGTQQKLQVSSAAAPQYSAPQDDEIGLRDFASAIWQGKLLIFCITAMFSVASVLYALSVPDEYKSTGLIAPASFYQVALGAAAVNSF